MALEITFDKDKLEVVPIGQVKPNTWNPKEENTDEYKKVVESIKDLGQRKPVVVRHNPEGGKDYEIVDGEQRYRACIELGFDKLLVYNEGELPDAQAKAMTLWYQVQAPFDKVEEAYLVSELAELEVNLPYFAAELEEMLALADFHWQEFDTDVGEPVTITTFSCEVTREQKEIILRALEEVKLREEGIADGRALELICADFLAGY
jgi:hypothetical protein